MLEYVVLIKELLESMDIDGSALNLLRRTELNKLIEFIGEDVLKETIKEKHHACVYPEIILQILCDICPQLRNPYTSINWIAPTGYVDELKLIFQPEQRSPEWYAFRKNRLTASDIGSVLGKNHYTKPEQILLKKCGYEKPFRMSPACAHGVKFEPIATQIYESRMNTTVHEFGCIAHSKYSFIGASPDGICQNGVMLEIKNPESREIIGLPPIQYFIQMQIQLEVCDLELCDYLECTYSFYETLKDLCEEEKDNTHGHTEFGPVIEYNTVNNPKEEKYEYCPVNITVSEKEKWVHKTMERLQTLENLWGLPKVTWWALKEYSLVRIRRNTAWFQEALPQLEQFWNKVLKQREIGIEAIVPPVRKKKQSVCRLLLDENEDSKTLTIAEENTVDDTEKKGDEVKKYVLQI